MDGARNRYENKRSESQASDRVISYFGVRGFPPIRQEKGEWMGHGIGTRTNGQRPQIDERVETAY
jgi:hypothetical protein